MFLLSFLACIPVVLVYGSTTTATFGVANNQDNREQLESSGAWSSLTATSIKSSSNTAASSRYHSGVLFTSVTIPQGTTILSAYLSLYTYLGSGDANFDLYGHAVDNAPSFGAGTQNLIDRARTTNTYFISLTNNTGCYQNLTCTSIVQEIVNNATWASGNNMTLLEIARSDANHSYRFRTLYYGDSYKPLLYVTYATGCSVTLNSPADSSTNQAYISLNFTYTPAIAGTVNNSMLYIYSGSNLYTTIANTSTLVNNVLNGINYTFTATNTYTWNVWVSNTTGGDYATANFTIIIASTRYMANQLWDTNYDLSLTQTSTLSYTSVYSDVVPVTIYSGIKIYAVLGNGSSVLVSGSTPVAIGSKSFTSSSHGGFSFSGTWAHSQINQGGVGVKVEVYMEANNPPTVLLNTFKTENMSFTSITGTPWTVTYYGDSSYSAPIITIHFDFGTSDNNSRIDGFELNSYAVPVATINDFYINNTWAGNSTQFAFDVSPSYSLDHAIFGCNVTGSAVNDSTTFLSATPTWINYTHTLPSYSCIVAFQLWLFTTDSSIYATTGTRYIKVYTYNSTAGAWNTPYISLSSLITTIEAANTWSAVEPYAATILDNNLTSLQSMIDNYATAHDWLSVLQWSAICKKLNITQQTDINLALNNFSMVSSLPQVGTDPHGNASFDIRYPCVLCGFYYAAQSWALAYNSSIMTKWNITAAYQMFNSSIYTTAMPVTWIYADGTSALSNPSGPRFYDECANTIECYLLFAELLNVSGALNDALHWWDYINTHLWNPVSPAHYKYISGIQWECEAPFFLKIIGELKYYYPNLQNWANVLTDIGNRFLSSEWNSAGWLEGMKSTTYVVTHSPDSNPTRRLENTLGAWQGLLGVYLQMNSTYQNDMKDMLYGNNNTEPAWALLLTPTAHLYDNNSRLFRLTSTDPFGDDNATAYAEILLFLMGIVPENTTIAFPLEELTYEYIKDIDPQMFQFDSRTQTTTIPVGAAGNITFQYGISPVTYVFNQSGIWQITFSNSWNMITNVTYVSALPTNRIYFQQIYTPTLPYDVTINAHCITEGADIDVQIAMDGSPTGYSTPHTFSGLAGSQMFAVLDNDANGDPFKRWSTGSNSTTIIVSSGGTYSAYYGTPTVRNVAVTDVGLYKAIVGQGSSLNVTVAVLDPGDYPETFNVTLYANTTEIETLETTLSSGNSAIITFIWNTTAIEKGMYIMGAYAWPVLGETDISDNNFTGGRVVVAGVGDLTGGTPNALDFVPDGKVDITDVAVVARFFGQKAPPAPANCDVSGPTIGVPDGKIDITDVATVAKHYGEHYPQRALEFSRL
jgi:hypothetical protein